MSPGHCKFSSFFDCWPRWDKQQWTGSTAFIEVELTQEADLTGGASLVNEVMHEPCHDARGRQRAEAVPGPLDGRGRSRGNQRIKEGLRQRVEVDLGEAARQTGRVQE